MKIKKPSKRQAIIRSTKFANLAEANHALIKEKLDYKNKIEKIDKQIERLKRKKEKIEYPGRADYLIAIAEQIKEKIGGNSIEIMGPFGLSSELSVWIWKGERDNDLNNIIFSLTTISSGKGFLIRTNENTNAYPEGSIGERNGFNYVSLEPTNEMDINWLIESYKAETV